MDYGLWMVVGYQFDVLYYDTNVVDVCVECANTLLGAVKHPFEALFTGRLRDAFVRMVQQSFPVLKNKTVREPRDQSRHHS
jgi:hypothetical protein